MANPKPTAPATTAKFSPGQKVNHPAADNGSFPSGCGCIECVEPWATGGGFSYKVRCDKTGQVLPAIFKEDELTAA